jgi:hypothetical protein
LIFSVCIKGLFEIKRFEVQMYVFRLIHAAKAAIQLLSGLM